MEDNWDPMNDAAQSLNRALEWDRFIELVQSEARSYPGKKLLKLLVNPKNWASSLLEARELQHETQEIIPLLDREALWGPLEELPDAESLMDRLTRGAILEIDELNMLRRWLYAIDSWIQLPREEIRGERFRKALASLFDPYQILKILELILTPEDELSEKASPRLRSLFHEIRQIKKEISNILDHLLKVFSQKGILQENFTDVRDGRYVIPIKISSQNEIDGIIYEASASRQTVFVEPKEVSILNNQLRQKQNELIQEIYSVLTETSSRIQPFAKEIEASINTLSYWDSIQAKARLGRHYSGKPIEVCEDRYFKLNQTAHPLLWWSIPIHSIIRNNIEFGNDARTLLLTGPNTGGKTVLLKTLGLAGICARTGFTFPGTDHPNVPFFDTFFADLGDPQSIENHLSSFSGHVLRFKEILEKLSNQSLVLIDELNSATDPEEGAAFGRAVLETLLSKSTMVVATTHDPQLKALPLTDTRILTASMAFDESAKSPTFQMVLGVPGRSRALETAERLGIPSQVIELAKSFLSRSHLEFEKLLGKLESDTQEALRAKHEALALLEHSEKLKKEWSERAASNFNDLVLKTRSKLKRIIEQAHDEIRASLKKLDEIHNRKELEKSRFTINEIFSQSSSQVERTLSEEAPEIAQILSFKRTSNDSESQISKLQVGGSVRIPKWKSIGTILEMTETRVKVAMGAIQMTLSPQEIEPLPGQHQGQNLKTMYSKQNFISSTFVPPSQIDLRGIRFDEAMSQLESYLDLSFRSGVSIEVKIIHGLGTGALREGTHKLLRSLPYIKTFRDGGIGQGGSGATIVEFDRN